MEEKKTRDSWQKCRKRRPSEAESTRAEVKTGSERSLNMKGVKLTSERGKYRKYDGQLRRTERSTEMMANSSKPPEPRDVEKELSH
jgi:hypothetical protein